MPTITSAAELLKRLERIEQSLEKGEKEEASEKA
jgi:hypothetical protein